MTRSRHRYSLRERTPVEMTYVLDDLVARFSHHQQAVGRAEGTRQRYRYTFLLFGRFLEAAGLERTDDVLTTATMEAFAIWLRQTPVNPQHGNSQRAESGIHGHMRDMRAFTRWLYRQELLEKEVFCPMPKLPKRLTRVLTEEELKRLWQSRYLTGSSPLAIRNRALIALMLDTGIRREEVARLTLDHLSLERRTLTVIGKGNKERRVFFSKAVRERLRAFLAIRGIDDEPLFHLSASGIRTTFRRIQLEVGLEKFHPHLLRHQFATTMLRNKSSVEDICLLLGHEDYNTTRRYLALTDQDLQKAHEAASPYESLMREDAPIELPKRRQRYSGKNIA